MHVFFTTSCVLGGGRHAAAGDLVAFASAAEARPWIAAGYARPAEPKEISAFEKKRAAEEKQAQKAASVGSGTELTENGDPKTESRDPRAEAR